ncbi:Vps52 / Sac2 family [Perilla frutescens var. frutescens]|nr:Vps52 / Sac2 family [Perilla frutescens var. frutescens]
MQSGWWRLQSSSAHGLFRGKPKTNVQILQQSVLLKYKYVILFLKEHGKEAYIDIHAAYIDTMNKSFSGACTSCLWILRLLNIFSVMNSLEKNQCFMTRLQLLRGCLLDFSWSATQFRGARFSGGDIAANAPQERFMSHHYGKT